MHVTSLSIASCQLPVYNINKQVIKYRTLFTSLQLLQTCKQAYYYKFTIVTTYKQAYCYKMKFTNKHNITITTTSILLQV